MTGVCKKEGNYNKENKIDVSIYYLFHTINEETYLASLDFFS